MRLLGAVMFRCAVPVSTNPIHSFVWKHFPQSHQETFKKGSNSHAIEINSTPSLGLNGFEEGPDDPIQHKL